MGEDIIQLLQRLLAAKVEFVLVGGVAAATYGATRNTFDLDVAAAFTPENMGRLLDALHDLHPKNAARPDLGEIARSPETLAQHRNLYLTTDLGRLDVLGELPPISYAEAEEQAARTQVFGWTCKVISLDHLITIKSSLDRPKDREVAAELKAIRARLRGVHSAS